MHRKSPEELNEAIHSNMLINFEEYLIERSKDFDGDCASDGEEVSVAAAKTLK